MKGIILAGGKGTRLLPLTAITNKHLLPIYNKPMVLYPLETLLACGISDILIVTGPHYEEHFIKLLKHGEDLGARISYAIQEEASGIAHALSMGRAFAENQSVAVILGDNIFSDTGAIADGVRKFIAAGEKGAKIFLKEVPDASRFGIAELQEGKIASIEEKPRQPKSNLAVTGLYLYDAEVFNVIDGLAPSARGEYEITDVNKRYLANNRVEYEIVKGDWTDAGTFDSLLRANVIAAHLSGSAKEIFEELSERLHHQIRRSKES